MKGGKEMGIIERFGDIMKANVNALFDSWEDPAKMVDQYLRDMRKDLADVTKDTAGVIAEETRCKRVLDKATENVTKWDDIARKALKAGNEGDAREALQKKAVATEEEASARKTYEVAKANADRMRQMHNKLVEDISTLERRRESIKAKASVAKTQEKVNKLTGKNSSSGVGSKFADLEGRVDKQLDAAMAEAELQCGADEDTALEDKYSGAGSASVDDELERLKREMGI